MENQIITTLVQLGLNSQSAKIYLAIVKLGEATIQQIARETGLKRTSLYYQIRQLADQGLVHPARHEKRHAYVAEPPSTFMRSVADRLKEFERGITELQSKQSHQTRHARVLFFNSFDGFRQIWQMIFQSGATEYLIITDPREMLNFVRKDYITKRIITEKVKRGIRSRQLIMPSLYAEEITKKDQQENRVSRVLPYDFPVPFTTIIFGDRVALISPFSEDLIIVIESQAYSATQRALFEALWQRLPLEIRRTNTNSDLTQTKGRSH